MTSLVEFTTSGVTRKAHTVRSIYARDYLTVTENESIVITKVMRYMCAYCSKIF